MMLCSATRLATHGLASWSARYQPEVGIKYKVCSDGTLERRKARWVICGDNQRTGIDSGETFTPAVKPATKRTILGLVANKQWLTNQLDVSNAFLHDRLKEKCTAVTTRPGK
jgi:hypothetical protein